MHDPGGMIMYTEAAFNVADSEVRVKFLFKEKCCIVIQTARCEMYVQCKKKNLSKMECLTSSL